MNGHASDSALCVDWGQFFGVERPILRRRQWPNFDETVVRWCHQKSRRVVIGAEYGDKF